MIERGDFKLSKLEEFEGKLERKAIIQRTAKRGDYVESQKSRNFVMISNAETLKDLKEIQEIFYNNQGVQMSLQKVVDHLIHFYLKER